MKTEPRTGRFFDSYAREFDAIFTSQGSIFTRLINHFFRKSTRLRYLKTLEECHPVEGKTVLDIGCGPGYYAIALAQRGAGRVLGIDVSPAMVELARQHAGKAGVEGRTNFMAMDFNRFSSNDQFDYTIAQGFMDYIPNAPEVVEKILSLTKSKAFFSFPKDGGFLAWQRKMRYRWKCDLFMYRREQVEKLFDPWRGKTKIEQISRDFFVTVELTP